MTNCVIPNDFYLYWQGNEFSIHQYICVQSIIDVEKPDNIYLYFNNPIPKNNIWWEETLKLVTLREFSSSEFPIFGHIISKGSQSISDLFRVMILYRYGGIYTDFDCISVRSIRDLIQDTPMFLSSCKNATSKLEHNIFLPIGKGGKKISRVSYVANGNMGAVARHPLLEKILTAFSENKYPNFRNEKNKVRPLPGLFTVINEYELYRGTDVKVLPWTAFHCIRERSKGIVKTIKSHLDLIDIEHFFQSSGKFPILESDEVKTYHYYSSKEDCSHLLNKMPNPFTVRFGNSVYSSYASKYMSKFLPNWKEDGYIVSPDRIILEQKIFPRLTGNVCFVGVAKYVKHYWDTYLSSVNVTTIDNNHKVAKYGAKQHIIAEMKHISKKTATMFDYIVMHGIAGYGSSTVRTLQYAFLGALQRLKPGGILIYGWCNNERLRVASSPLKLLKTSFGTHVFKQVSFFDLPPTVVCNNYFDKSITYNVPEDQLQSMDVRFTFFKAPE